MEKEKAPVSQSTQTRPTERDIDELIFESGAGRPVSAR